MTFQTTCPCQCGEQVAATDAGFSATTVEVAACKSLREQGVASTNWRKSSLAVLSDSVLRHSEGLVTFA